MTTAEILTGLRPVTMECFDVFAPYYEERAKHYVYPRYMQSVCAMLDMGKCYYNIIRANHGKVLVVYKRTQIFGKTGVQMPICPISLTGATQDELSVMLAALKVGISLRVTTEDITRYRIPRNICSDGTGPFVPVNNEYIYNALNGAAMCGSPYRKLRNLTKRITKASGYALLTGAHPQAESVVRDWGERYKQAYNEQADQTHLWHICKTAPEALSLAIPCNASPCWNGSLRNNTSSCNVSATITASRMMSGLQCNGLIVTLSQGAQHHLYI